MAKPKPKTNSPLLGYNTNVRHLGKLFHIQTEDSGIDHPHVITHLFTEGTILGTKKTSYKDQLDVENVEEIVRQLMREQHKAMFIALREGEHDATAAKILGDAFLAPTEETEPVTEQEQSESQPLESQPPETIVARGGVQIISPAAMDRSSKPASDALKEPPKEAHGRSIFDTPDQDGEFGNDLISDKSLDEVILSYLTDELDE